MAKSKNNDYTNESISKLKGADRVRLRPAVIFGSDGLDGCEHAVFEILSNSIDEAREGYGNLIEVKKYLDNSIEVTDYGRGIPVDYNPKEGMFNWELVFASFTQAVNIKPIRAKTTNTASAQTDSVRAQRSIRRNIWTLPFTATDTNTICILKKALT